MAEVYYLKSIKVSDDNASFKKLPINSGNLNISNSTVNTSNLKDGAFMVSSPSFVSWDISTDNDYDSDVDCGVSLARKSILNGKTIYVDYNKHEGNSKNAKGETLVNTFSIAVGEDLTKCSISFQGTGKLEVSS